MVFFYGIKLWLMNITINCAIEIKFCFMKRFLSFIFTSDGGQYT